MPRRRKTTIKEQHLIVKLALKGNSLRKIGQIVGKTHSTIQKIVDKFKYEGTVHNKAGRGRKSILTERDERNIVLQVRRNPRQSIPRLTRRIASQIGTSICRIG